MSDKTDFFVSGYRFGSYEDAEQARLDKKKAEYFNSKLKGKSAQNILAVYDNILDEKIFTTPVGWEYLKKLQEQLHLLGIPEENIRPIPMFVTFAYEKEDKTLARERIRPAKKKDVEKNKLRTSILINIILGILVIAMFAITLESDNPNILNYRNVIVDEYAQWEQELTEREKELRQRESELN